MNGTEIAVMFVVVAGCTKQDDEPPTGENIARHTELPKTTAVKIFGKPFAFNFESGIQTDDVAKEMPEGKLALDYKYDSLGWNIRKSRREDKNYSVRTGIGKCNNYQSYTNGAIGPLCQVPFVVKCSIWAMQSACLLYGHV
ncbi:hypothetical protein BC351_08325 [Paenibacillus ferrarius]|uniref:Uncharacterized protein n=1 Tax=Paenibacillus ferrarius TaxID=1469647 RepID=A0A1V4H9V6_9BACL|nr:hypothetical protein [Paenibacillus ferrarius]OPH48464.1 hypothetical protein BC351_08325 [Paenibacillus ferrarius]